MIPRDSEQTIRTLLRGFPVITLTGPRQSGKTTLAKAIFVDRPYASLEDPDIRRAAQDDPRSFLERFPDGGVLDEVQRCPELLSYLQTIVDADGRMGLFILTGSQQFGLMSGITQSMIVSQKKQIHGGRERGNNKVQNVARLNRGFSQFRQSLAGRSAFIELLPFSLPELSRTGKLTPNADLMLLTGCYPPLYDREVAPTAWFAAYMTAYVERDVRQQLKIQDLDSFQRFVRLCAGRTGQLLNLSSLATECGITHNTAKAWISVLEASFLVFLLRPHHASFNKRLIKMPKLYFYDTGLVSWLLGIRTLEQMETHPLRGNIFENFVIAELVKSQCNRAEPRNLYFWRDSNGNEVDIIVEHGAMLMPIEIKSGKTVNRDFFSGLERWLSLAGDSALSPTLIHGGADAPYHHKGIQVRGWQESGALLL